MVTVFSNVPLIKFQTIGLFSLTRHECGPIVAYITSPPVLTVFISAILVHGKTDISIIMSVRYHACPH
jgi:hypothetical protein